MLTPEDEIVEGVQGAKIEFELAIVDENDRPVDTTVYDEFKVCIKADTNLEVSQVANANGSVMTKVGSAECGIFNVLINPADTANLEAKERQDIEFRMSEAADPTNIVGEVFEDKLTVKKSNCT